MARGGARAGAGRKPTPPEFRTQKHTLNLTPLEFTIYKREGGGRTLRAMIQKGYFVREFEKVNEAGELYKD